MTNSTTTTTTPRMIQAEFDMAGSLRLRRVAAAP